MYKPLPPVLAWVSGYSGSGYALLYVKCGATTTVVAADGRIAVVAVSGWIVAANVEEVAPSIDPDVARVGL